MDKEGKEGLVYMGVRWLTNATEVASSLAKHRCKRDHRHVHLFSGRAEAAAKYPPSLCRIIVKGIGAQMVKDLMDFNAVDDYFGTRSERSREEEEEAQADFDEKMGYHLQLLDEEPADLMTHDAEAYDDVKGGRLDPSKVLEAR